MKLNPKPGADCLVSGLEVTYNVFECLCDGLAGVTALHDHGRLYILHQLGCSALQEALGALCLWLPASE